MNTGTSTRQRTRFGSVEDAARLALCSLTEPATVQHQHLAALLAWTPGMAMRGDKMVIPFDHAPTAWWASEAMATNDAEVSTTSGTNAAVTVKNPRIVLGRFGYRGDRWIFRQGHHAALGIARGAVQAGGQFSRAGLRIACPTPAAMLTLVAVLRRIGVNSPRPNDGTPRVTIGATAVDEAMWALGIEGAGELFRQSRGTVR